jgi:hypothetical protein
MHNSMVTRRVSHGALIAAALLVTALVYGLSVALAPPAHAAGAPWIVSVGDSYISGEAGRWAGNTNGSPSAIDALGPSAYFDNSSNTGELIAGCHRSKSAEVLIGGRINGENLACEDAKTSTYTTLLGQFKPGLDFYNSGGQEGQALMLQHFAATHNVKLVAVTIGGNNFNFEGIVETCLLDWATSPWWFQHHCSEDASIKQILTPSNVATQTAAIKGGLQNVAQAMTNAGYSSSQYTILVQDYPSPMPNGSGFRYPESSPARQVIGGCGIWNSDANYANSTILPTIDGAVMNAAAGAGLANVKTMDLVAAFNGHRLCESGVGLLEEKGLTSWAQPEAVNKTEWINQIRTVTAILPPYQLQEDLHPNYWAQLALRNCLTQAYNGGTPKGGKCTISGSGLNSAGEPNMSLH